MTGALDCVVIGSGPGGYVAAIRAAQLGMRVAIVEREPSVGGRCLHWACIPAKTVLRSADILSEIREAADYGIGTGSPTVNFEAISERRKRVVNDLAAGVHMLLKKNRIEIITGVGSLEGERLVRIGDRRIHAATAVVVATGSVRRALQGTEFGGRVIGTEEAWAFDLLPDSLAVVGAGASGVEIASAYARLGTHVQLFEDADRVLPAEDADISARAGRGLQDQGIEVRTSTRLTDVRDEGDRVSFAFGAARGEAQWLVVAAGRAPDVDALGLERLGVTFTEFGFVEIDAHMRTSVPGLYAIGDATPGPALAHKASDEGIIAVETAAGNSVVPLRHVDIPRATFSAPNVASIGLTEEAARSAGYDVVIGSTTYGAVGAGSVYGDRKGLVKIVGERTYGEILGAHIVGSRATELIQELVNAKLLEGGFSDLARIVHSHPTLSEAIVESARAADGWLIHG